MLFADSSQTAVSFYLDAPAKYIDMSYLTLLVVWLCIIIGRNDYDSFFCMYLRLP